MDKEEDSESDTDRNNEELQLVRNAIINRAFRDKYLNVNRMLRDLSNVDDSFRKASDGDAVGKSLNSLLKMSDDKFDKLASVVDELKAKLEATP